MTALARPKKSGLSYFPLDVDFFENPKIKILRARYGRDGIVFYIYLLCEIYKQGYYIQVDDDFEYIISDDLKMDQNKAKQVLNFLLSRSLFDNTLFQSDKVLTSAGIQRRFQLAVKERARKNPIEVGRFWLLKKEDTEPFIKCTLFAVKPASPFSPLKACPDICYENLQLKQKYGVFSQGRVDEGTSLLLKNLPQNLNGLKVLDLGCGCGIIGLYLAKKGASVTFSDISAEALFLAELNAKENGLKESCEFKASFMLDDAPSFDVIATNPPFHEGIKKAEKVTLEMIKEAPNHLNKGGALYLVGNSFLNYGPTLEEAFEKVTVIESNKRFSVFKASN